MREMKEAHAVLRQHKSKRKIEYVTSEEECKYQMYEQPPGNGCEFYPGQQQIQQQHQQDQQNELAMRDLNRQASMISNMFMRSMQPPQQHNGNSGFAQPPPPPSYSLPMYQGSCNGFYPPPERSFEKND
jgi:hypothetical protein